MSGKWVAKAIVQKAISFLPNAQRVNYLFQHHITHSTTLSEDFLRTRIDWAAMHLSTLERLGGSREGFRAVELGSGWYPIIPLCYFLAGAESVYMVDLEDLTRPELTLQAMTGLLDSHERGELEVLGSGLDVNRIARLAEARTRIGSDGQNGALESLGISALPTDARRLELPAAPHLISSNTVFEHIGPDVLEAILRRFLEISEPGTVMSHLVDHCDHYAYIDSSVSVYNFLRFSDRAWRMINNSIQPMNRLRASEYVDMYRRCGIELTEEHLQGCEPLALVGEPLAPRFKTMDPADVACVASHLVTRFG